MIDEIDLMKDKAYVRSLSKKAPKRKVITQTKTKKKITENEKKVGYALVDLLENWEPTFKLLNGGTKYNKNSVLETMRNYTNMSTKDIRLSMRRYKDIYTLLKKHGM